MVHYCDHTCSIIWKAQYKAWVECKVEQVRLAFFENSEIISNNSVSNGQYFNGETDLIITVIVIIYLICDGS